MHTSSLYYYAAFLRGISPTDKNMRNEKLREVFTALGYKNVRSVISSGNILFSSAETDQTKLEKEIEAALKLQLGIGGKTLVRSADDISKY